MSDSEDVQRRSPTSPDQGGDRRRLLFIGHPDPFLVTRLPLEAVVSNGAVRLNDGKTVLGFAHHRLPEGTRVRVGYRDWLYAELLEADEAAEGPPDEEPVYEDEAGAPTSSGSESAAIAEVDSAEVPYPESPKEPTAEAAAGPSAAPPPEAEQADMFPDDLTTSEREHAPVNRDSERDSWTDAFRRRRDPDPEQEP
jgi:predicted component of type VI protein secretion system